MIGPSPELHLVAMQLTTTHEIQMALNLNIAWQAVLKDKGVDVPNALLRIEVEMQNVESDQPLANLISYVRDEIIKQATSAHIEYNQSSHSYEITIKVEAPAKIPAEKLEAYLLQKDWLSEDILSTWAHNLIEREVQGQQELYEALEKMEGDLKKTLTSTSDIEYNIREFLALAADTIAIGSFAYQLVLWIIQRKRQEYLGTNKTLVGQMANERVSKLLDFFRVVPKARIMEISVATGINPEQAKSLMKALCFEHESACFWRPPTINDQVLRDAARTNILKWKIGLWVERHKRPVKLLLIGAIVIGVYYTIESSLNPDLLTLLFLFEMLLICIILLW